MRMHYLHRYCAAMCLIFFEAAAEECGGSCEDAPETASLLQLPGTASFATQQQLAELQQQERKLQQMEQQLLEGVPAEVADAFPSEPLQQPLQPKATTVELVPAPPSLLGSGQASIPQEKSMPEVTNVAAMHAKKSPSGLIDLLELGAVQGAGAQAAAQEVRMQTGTAQELHSLQQAAQTAQEAELQLREAAENFNGALLDVQRSEQLQEQRAAEVAQAAQDLQMAEQSARAVQAAEQTLVAQDGALAELMDTTFGKLQAAKAKVLNSGEATAALDEAMKAVSDAQHARVEREKTKAQATGDLLAALQGAAGAATAVTVEQQDALAPLLQDALQRLQPAVDKLQGAEAAVDKLQLAQKNAARMAEMTAAAAAANTETNAAQNLQEPAQTLQAPVSVLQAPVAGSSELQATTAQKLRESTKKLQASNEKLQASEEARDALASKVVQLRKLVDSAAENAEVVKRARAEETAKAKQLSQLIQGAVQLAESEEAAQPTRAASEAKLAELVRDAAAIA
eukprot:gnl/TRDRNA2_/TRDRNA2_183226_c0_seq1.p1 gnl/TRDRNA2_/TRDRNA2_183226_c0~~gnl/TRDRNA2_/TRDRNA2_183226_c0_seq1.p1  ORF type:complete len:513 (-),score=189.00 gnl/TRDRNA2_/TRDRNA2_183226_c0_seq1:80-1618(-)